MRRLAAFTILAALAVSASSAAAAKVRFRGAFTVIEVRNCIARYVGETFNSALRPGGLGDNPAVTSLTQLNEFSGDVYELPGAMFKLSTWTPVQGHGIDNLHYAFNARILITGQSPQAITGRTGFVNLIGWIENMGNDPGKDGSKCVAAFRGAYFRRVE